MHWALIDVIVLDLAASAWNIAYLSGLETHHYSQGEAQSH
jgi:hypothetical protein